MATRTRTAYGAASVVMTIFTIIAAIIAIYVVLVLLGASGQNALVRFFHDAGGFFAHPFAKLFPQDHPKQDYLVNWGIAALAYLFVGAILAGIIRRA
jgi:hypothetical protein